MYSLKVRESFDAAHFLLWHKGKCKSLHGHRWEVEAVIAAEGLSRNGIVIDFGIVKGILKEILPDHTNLNDIYDNPTAEILAHELFYAFEDRLAKMDKEEDLDRGYGVRLRELTVWESPNCGMTYTPDSLPVVMEKDSIKFCNKMWTDFGMPMCRESGGRCFIFDPDTMTCPLGRRYEDG